MTHEELIAELEGQLDSINQAIAALRGTGGRRGRTRRQMSAEARRKISQAQKKRWAAQKKK